MSFMTIMWCIELPIILGMIALYIYARLRDMSEKMQHKERQSYDDRF